MMLQRENVLKSVKVNDIRRIKLPITDMRNKSQEKISFSRVCVNKNYNYSNSNLQARTNKNAVDVTATFSLVRTLIKSMTLLVLQES